VEVAPLALDLGQADRLRRLAEDGAAFEGVAFEGGDEAHAFHAAGKVEAE
jgi:hypothetical protein